jgi:hypothetical protein
MQPSLKNDMKAIHFTALTSSLVLLLVVPRLRAASETIYPDAVVPAARANDSPNIELGTIFRSTAPGQITQVRVFSLADESGDHAVHLWQNSPETLLFSTNWTFGGDEAWISLAIPALRVQANSDYTISISAPATGWYPANSHYFDAPGDNGQHLSFPQGAGVFNATPGSRPTSSYNNAAYLRDIVFQADAVYPVMGIQSNGLDIPAGEVAPNLGDGTQFGGVKLGGVQSRTFTVVNSGTSPLVLSGAPAVALAGPQSGDFTVTTQPVSPVAPGGSATFTIRFAPSATGTHDATVTITSNVRAPFQFAIEGIGMSSGNLILGNRSEGNAAAAIDDHWITGNRFLALRNMRVTAINAKVLEPVGTTANFKCAIYADASGASGPAGQFLQGTAVVANPTNGWQSFALTQPVNLGAGSNYWLVIWSDTIGARVYGDAGGVAQHGDYPYADWPDPLTLAAATPAITYSLYAEGVPTDDSGPEMYVKGSGNPIVDGSTNASVADGTDLGGTTATSGTRAQTFTIYNVGQAALNLGGTPAVALTGPQAGDFVVATQPAATIPPGGSTTFAMQFAPSAYGVRQVTVTIPHADSPAHAYAFAIQGLGLGGGAGILGNDGQGAYARDIGGSQIHGNRFQAPANMRITQLHAKVLPLTGTFKCAVYSDFNGWANRLLQSSVEVVNATNGWNTFPLTSPLDVTAGDHYWLVIWSDTPSGALVQADTFGTSYFGAYAYLDLGGQWPDPVILPGSSQLSFLDAPARTYCIYGEGTALGTQPGPELDLRGHGKLIVAGDTTPSTLDGTDFGSAAIHGSGVDQTFTITNSGNAPLQLTGSPVVAVSGRHARDFTVSSQPASPIAPGGGATFTVHFSPLNQGLRTATISVANNDALENPYQFAVQGAGFITGRESIWPATLAGKDIDFDGTAYDLGTIFQSSVAGTIAQLRVYSVAGESGNHTASIWRNDDQTVIGGGPWTWNYGGINGWITFNIPSVDIDANTLYTVSISTGTSAHRDYPNVAGGAANPGDNGQHLSYPANAGVFSTSPPPPETLPTGYYNGGNYLRDIVFVPAGSVGNFPAMSVQGLGASIANGSASPSSTNGTDFGQVAVGGNGADHTFTINATGQEALNLTATPAVTIEGPQAAEFSVIAQPALSIAAGGASAFTIRFTPAAAGTRNATVSIENDSDSNPYAFALAGTGSVALRITAITPDLNAGNVTLRWESQGQQFQVYRANKVTGPFIPIGAPQTGNSYTDIGILKTNASAFYRIGY